MSPYQLNLYQELTQLCQECDSFFSKDHVKDGRTYRLFNYRLASWTDFQRPSALDCRGTMFDITDGNIKLVSLPPKKAFNWHEGSVDHSGSVVLEKMVKLDGSLISTYKTPEGFSLKSKASLTSDQAIAAMEYLKKKRSYYDYVARLVATGFTVSMEYCSPTNRIVVPYQEDSLNIIHIRNNKTGEYLSPRFFDGDFECVSVEEQPRVYLTNEMIDAIRQETTGEGYIFHLIDPFGKPYSIKVKNDRYLTLHLTKDSINSLPRLIDAIVDETADDLRGMFSDDPASLDRINQTEEVVLREYNKMVVEVETFHQSNTLLERKDFAIKCKAEQPFLMGLIMCLYLGKPVDYKTFFKKNKETFINIGKDAEKEE